MGAGRIKTLDSETSRSITRPWTEISSTSDIPIPLMIIFFYYKQCKIVYSFFCFSILINTKCYYPLYESMWEKRSDLETLNFTWEKIDISRIKQLYEIFFAKSNFKLLHCIVNSNLAVSGMRMYLPYVVYASFSKTNVSFFIVKW